MQWNDLDWATQMKVLDRFGDILLQETDERLQFAMAAGIVELEIWSNTPCEVLHEDGYVADAHDFYCEDGWDI